MPVPCTRRMLKVLNSTEWDPILLLSIRLAGQKDELAVRLTDAQETVSVMASVQMIVQP